MVPIGSHSQLFIAACWPPLAHSCAELYPAAGRDAGGDPAHRDPDPAALGCVGAAVEPGVHLAALADDQVVGPAVAVDVGEVDLAAWRADAGGDLALREPVPPRRRR